jgi:hypothetical protein
MQRRSPLLLGIVANHNDPTCGPTNAPTPLVGSTAQRQILTQDKHCNPRMRALGTCYRPYDLYIRCGFLGYLRYRETGAIAISRLHIKPKGTTVAIANSGDTENLSLSIFGQNFTNLIRFCWAQDLLVHLSISKNHGGIEDTR